MSRLTLALGLVLLAAEASLAVWMVATSDHEPDKTQTIALAVTSAVMFVLAGLVALWRRPSNRTGTFLAATGYLWFLGALSNANDPWVFTLGWIVGGAAWIPFAALVLVHPSGRFESRTERAFPLAVAAVIAIPSLLEVLVDPTPASSYCDGCPESTLVIADLPDVAGTVEAVEVAAGLALVIVAAALLARRWRRATPALRRALLPVLLTGSATLASLFVVQIVQQISDAAADALVPIFFVSLGLVPVAFLIGILRTRLAVSSVAGVALALEQGTPLRDALARALGDPSLEIAYWIEDRQTWVDAGGRRRDAPARSADRSVTTVERDGKRIAALVHDPALDEEPQLVESVAAAAGLSLQNERLHAELRAQYAFLETIADTAPSLLVHVDTEGRILNQNRAAVAAAGREHEEQVRGRYFWEVFIDPEERQAMKARFAAAAPDFPPAEYENTFTNVRGERLVIDWRSAPVLDGDGRVVSIVAGGIDITERQRQADERERERVFLNAIANNAPSLLCLIDEEGRVADRATNIAFERTLEYDPSETGGHIFWERYVDPSAAEEVRALIERVVAGEVVPEHDTSWITRTGRRLLIAWTCTPLPRIDERKLLLISGVDVTERRHRELDLERERDATTTVLQTIPSVVAVLDKDFEMVNRDTDNPVAAVNRAFREALQWRDDQLVGRSLLELIADDDGRARAALTAAARGQPSPEVESEWLRADGERVTFAWSASPVADVTGRTDGLVLVSGVDVTERKAQELEAAHRRAFIDAINDTIPSFLLGMNEEAIVREQGVNRAFGETFGWLPDEIEGKSFVGTVVAEEDHAARMAIANAANGVVQGELESVWRGRDGAERVVAWTARPVLDIRGEPVVLVSGSDVTVRRRQEEELRASRARLVEAADDARRKLERNLHDGAQQRLVALSVSLRLAESKLRDDPEAASALLAGSREELTHALEELRELARGIHPAVLTDRGLGAAVEALVERSPVPVEVDVRHAPYPSAVEAAAYYVVSEALANVAKYAQASSVRVQIAAENSHVVVVVSDDGVGGADPTQGSGLRGLADRVAALDGILTVESPSGSGTCVRALLPVRPDVPA